MGCLRKKSGVDRPRFFFGILSSTEYSDKGGVLRRSTCRVKEKLVVLTLSRLSVKSISARPNFAGSTVPAPNDDTEKVLA